MNHLKEYKLFESIFYEKYNSMHYMFFKDCKKYLSKFITAPELYDESPYMWQLLMTGEDISSMNSVLVIAFLEEYDLVLKRRTAKNQAFDKFFANCNSDQENKTFALHDPDLLSQVFGIDIQVALVCYFLIHSKESMYQLSNVIGALFDAQFTDIEP